jgi:hypothetical protein
LFCLHTFFKAFISKSGEDTVRYLGVGTLQKPKSDGKTCPYFFPRWSELKWIGFEASQVLRPHTWLEPALKYLIKTFWYLSKLF